MRAELVIAAALTLVIGVLHSWLGERYIVVRLLRRPDLPELFGDDTFTRRTVRFAWHLTTVAWWGLATVLFVLSGAIAGVHVARAALLAISVAFLASAVLAIVVTRARHLSWIVFLSIAVLCALATR